MGKIYSKTSPLPAACVVYAGNLSPYQHIIFQTRYDVKGYYQIMKDERGGVDIKSIGKDLEQSNTILEWAIKSVNVSTVRDWSTSTAMITLTCKLGNPLDPIPSLPDLSKIRGGNHPYLTVEDEIRIYSGYLDSPSTVIDESMLDDYSSNPFDEEGRMNQNPNKPMAPIFWGFIDKIDILGNAKGGIQCIISCRDRSRIFQDTKIISLPSLDGTERGVIQGRREVLLLDAARAALGDITGDRSKAACWKSILDEKDGAQVFTAYKNGADDRTSFTDEVGAEDPAKWVRTASHKVMDYQSRPRFHRWVQRPPLVKAQGAASVFQVLNKSPMEIMMFLAATEEMPIDFFASHVNGDFLFVPRVLDTSGFKDPLRSYRTYFFRDYPRDKAKPSPNQQIIDMRVASSSMATYNKYVVVDSNTNGPTSATLGENVKLTLQVLPWVLGDENNDRKITPPCRTMVVFDGSLSTYSNPQGGALIIATAAARIFARDINQIEMTVLGDPTLYPNEAVRVYNSILHDSHTLTSAGTKDSYIEREKALENNRKEALAGTSDTSKPIEVNTSQSGSIEKVLSTGVTETDKSSLNLPVYKIRNVTHKIVTQGKNAGYTTTIGMVSDY